MVFIEMIFSESLVSSSTEALFSCSSFRFLPLLYIFILKSPLPTYNFLKIKNISHLSNWSTRKNEQNLGFLGVYSHTVWVCNLALLGDNLRDSLAKHIRLETWIVVNELSCRGVKRQVLLTRNLEMTSTIINTKQSKKTGIFRQQNMSSEVQIG